MDQLRNLLVIHNPAVRMWMQVAGFALIFISLTFWVISWAFSDNRYLGVRRRPKVLEPWHVEPVPPPVRPFALPWNGKPGAHRAHVGPTEGTRTIHPGQIYAARAMIPEPDMYPSEEEPEVWERRRLRRDWQVNLKGDDDGDNSWT